MTTRVARLSSWHLKDEEQEAQEPGGFSLKLLVIWRVSEDLAARPAVHAVRDRVVLPGGRAVDCPP